MKFSTLFSTLLSTLSLIAANVIPPLAELPTALAKRGADDTPCFNAFEKAHADLAVGKSYAFTIKYEIGDKPDPNPDIRAIQEELGFCHIVVMVGKATERIVGPKGKQKKERDFGGTFYHMIKKTDGTVESDFKIFDWKKMSKGRDYRIEYSKETKKSHDQIKAIGM
jgi:hypothetical protein